LAAVPPLQRPGQLDLKDLREIKARQARTQTAIGTVIAIETATGTKTTMQAHRRRVRKDNILSKTPTDGGPALEIKDIVRSARPDAGETATS